MELKNMNSMKDLEDARQRIGLKEVPVRAALAAFQESGLAGDLSCEQFCSRYQALLIAHGIAAPSWSQQKRAFEMFDRDHNGLVDMMELICGVTSVCGGTELEKIQATFDLFDEDKDGFISTHEMYNFTLSVCKVILTREVMREMQQQGIDVDSPEDLASVTTTECFRSVDLNQDGRLSVDEFKHWLFGNEGGPGAVGQLFG